MRLARIGAGVLALLVSLPACSLAGELGDFGRAPFRHVEPSYPTARNIGSDRPSLLVTDEEQEMLDRFWRFMRMPDGHHWDDGGPKQQAGRGSAPQGDWRGPIDRYFLWLKQTRFASSHTRFNALTDAIEADLGTLGETFRAICVVLDLDDRRSIALAGLSVQTSTANGVLLRHNENVRLVRWFAAALGFRYQSYSFALDHLLVETPHEEARRSDIALTDLATWTAAAEREDFCGDGPGAYDAEPQAAIRGRVLMGDHERVEQK